jgi:hypothetical protein
MLLYCMGFIDRKVIAVGCTNHCKDVLATADGFFRKTPPKYQSNDILCAPTLVYSLYQLYQLPSGYLT